MQYQAYGAPRYTWGYNNHTITMGDYGAPPANLVLSLLHGLS